jgi:cytidine deaminase
MDKDDAVVLLSLLEKKAELPPPRQSNFRVVAELTYDVERSGAHDAPPTAPTRAPSAAPRSKPSRVFGANYEGGPHIGVCCCAERAALGSLRQHERRGQTIRLRCCYIATDSAQVITPGALCREFLYSIAGGALRVCLAADTPQVHAELEALAAGSRGAPSDAKYAMTGGLQVIALETLFPLASIYSLLDAAAQLALGAELAPRIAATVPPKLAAAHGAAVAATSRDDRDALHRMRYAAVAVDAAGAVMATAYQMKALEYGCTPCPVCQLVATVQSEGGRARRAAIAHILLVDHFGVCHAPWAAARSLLAEHAGFENVRCWAHALESAPPVEAEAGGRVAPRALVLTSLVASELLPGAPDMFCDSARTG